MEKFTSQQVYRAIDNAAARLGYSSVKAKQRAAIEAFVAEGKDVFVSLPTGYGKSLCYTLLPWVFDELRGEKNTSIVLCVSPLTSLMIDQRQKYEPRGIAAEFVGGVQEDVGVVEKIEKGCYQLVYISPESLLGDNRWREMLRGDVYQKNLVGFCIDESHCVKKWGDKFRVEFARLGEVRSLIPPNVNVMALTATATQPTRKEIIKRLEMKKPVFIYMPPAKPNIVYVVLDKPTIEDVVLPIVNELQTKGTEASKKIIYCRTYDQVSQFYSLFFNLLGSNFTSTPGAVNLAKYRLVDMFSKCTQSALKESIVSSFVNPKSRLRVVIATVAFGMGLDCPCVREIIHWGPSEDIDMYVQEIGRAGRDGELSVVTLFWRPSDQQNTSKSMMDYCRNEQNVCRRKLLYADFEDSDLVTPPSLKCRCCNVCNRACVCGSCKSVYSGFTQF